MRTRDRTEPHAGSTLGLRPALEVGPATGRTRTVGLYFRISGSMVPRDDPLHDTRYRSDARLHIGDPLSKLAAVSVVEYQICGFCWCPVLHIVPISSSRP